jgi:diadenosine tetraphosphate (Ap4A) HIT family hydrolase
MSEQKPDWWSLDWNELRDGKRCPLCDRKGVNAPYWTLVGELSVSTLTLGHDARFRGFANLIFDPRHVTCFEDMTDAEYTAYMDDLRRAARAIRDVVKPDHMNYDYVGALVPHMHMHIFPRFKTDMKWGMPVYSGWTNKEFAASAIPYEPDDLASLVRQIAERLEATKR